MLQDVSLYYRGGQLVSDSAAVFAPALLPAATTAAQGAVVLDGTASDIKPTGTAGAAGASGKAAAADHVHAASVWTAADQGFAAWNYDMGATASGGTTALATAGTVYTFGVPLRQAATVTNIVVALIANGGTLTSGQCFGALYTGAAGSLVGQTADQSAAWGAGATKLVTMALAGGPFAVAAGIVQVALWFNGTTGPSFFKTASNAALANAGLATSLSRYGTANTSVTTTAPGTLGTISAASNGYWVALS